MTDAQWLIYIYGIYPNIVDFLELLIFAGGIIFLVSVIASLIAWDENDLQTQNKVMPILKKSVIGLFTLVALRILLPSRDILIAIWATPTVSQIASQTVKSVSESNITQQLDSIIHKSINLLDVKLSKEIEEAKK